MLCRNCGRQVPESSAFCTECGAKVEKAEQQDYSPEYETPENSTPYTQPQQNSYYAQPGPQRRNEAVSVGTYVGMTILSGIPLIGLIMMCVWAFSADENQSKKNFARAMLILMAIGFVLSIVLLIIIGVASAAVFNMMDMQNIMDAIEPFMELQL